mmetsp:Transcript_25286/g.60142  ORF Transcript_25286/g.60142 Transcript_25286/m.60142 type:complete len:228 (-) Transcript_25286:1710-2393(-)
MRRPTYLVDVQAALGKDFLKGLRDGAPKQLPRDIVLKVVQVDFEETILIRELMPELAGLRQWILEESGAADGDSMRWRREVAVGRGLQHTLVIGDCTWHSGVHEFDLRQHFQVCQDLLLAVKQIFQGSLQAHDFRIRDRQQDKRRLVGCDQVLDDSFVFKNLLILVVVETPFLIPALVVLDLQATFEDLSHVNRLTESIHEAHDGCLHVNANLREDHQGRMETCFAG